MTNTSSNSKFLFSNIYGTFSIKLFINLTGMINILHGIGLRLLSLGHHTPFMVKSFSFTTFIDEATLIIYSVINKLSIASQKNFLNPLIRNASTL